MDASPISSLVGYLLHRRTMGVFAVAAILSIKTAMECHGAIALSHFDAPFIASLLRSLVVWYWWAAVALVLWALSERSTSLLRFSWEKFLMQLGIGCLLAGLHVWLRQEARP